MAEIVKDENLHGMSRFGTLSHGLIDKCQRDYVDGSNLDKIIPGINRETILQIVSETYSGDRLIKSTDAAFVLDQPLSRFDDWSLAVLFEITTQLADRAKMEQRPAWFIRNLNERGFMALKAIVESPGMSPCLDYGHLFFEVAEMLKHKKDKQAIEIAKNGIAEELINGNGLNIIQMLRDLASMYLSLSEPDSGLSIYTNLVRYDPKDIWHYVQIPFALDSDTYAGIGLKAAQRGLTLLEIEGDKHKLHKQLSETIADLQKSADNANSHSENTGSIALKELEEALDGDFTPTQSLELEELCRKIIPDLDARAKKQYPDHLEVPTREDVKRNLARKLGLSGESAKEKPGKIGRNDPCPCGSGKKYKKCCLINAKIEAEGENDRTMDPRYLDPHF
jgi:hypothetical protein